MSSSFTKKSLIAYLTLAGATFDGENNTKIVDGLRMDAEIKKGGHPAKNTLKLKIYGMPSADMDALTTLAFKPMRVKKNLIRLQAGDSGIMTTVFQGDITAAYASYSSPPNLLFHVEAAEGYYPSIATSRSKGFKGGTSVVQLMQNLAQQMGYGFENNGVDSILASPYLIGSSMQQASALAEAADLEFGVDDGVLFIAPRNRPRAGEAPLISAETGMKEYPTFDKNGLKFTCLYNPGLKLGGLCVVQSKVPVANGTWRIHGLDHTLSSEDPSAKWESKVHATQPGMPPPQELGGSGGGE